MTLEPIETYYGGTKYRSRTEARWAVMLDHAGVGYQYEPDGFELVSGRYVPDFWISGWDRYLEIKPDGFEFSPGEWPRERCVAEELAERSRKEVLVAGGWPDHAMELYCIKPDGIPSISRRLLSDFIDPHAIQVASKHRFDWPGSDRGKKITDMIRRTAYMKRFPT